MNQLLGVRELASHRDSGEPMNYNHPPNCGVFPPTQRFTPFPHSTPTGRRPGQPPKAEQVARGRSDLAGGCCNA